MSVPASAKRAASIRSFFIDTSTTTTGCRYVVRFRASRDVDDVVRLAAPSGYLRDPVRARRQRHHAERQHIARAAVIACRDAHAKPGGRKLSGVTGDHPPDHDHRRAHAVLLVLP